MAVARQFVLIFTMIMLLLLNFTVNARNPKLTSQSTKQFQLTAPDLPANRPAHEYKVHNIGNLSVTVSNHGLYGTPNFDTPALEWPRGSGASYLWIGAFWAGGIVDGEKLCTCWDTRFSSEWQPSLESSFDFGPGKSMQDHYVIYDDLLDRPGHHPLGVKVRERGLTWHLIDYDDFIVYEYEIENVGENIIQDFFVGWHYDFDICWQEEFTDYILDDLVDYEGWDGSETDTDILDVVDPLDLDNDGKTGYDEFGWPYGLPFNKNGVPTNPYYDEESIEPDGFYDEWQIFLDESGPIIHWQTNRNPAWAYAGTPAVVKGDTLRGYLIPRNASYMFDYDFDQTPENDIGEREGSLPCPGFVFGRMIYSDIITRSDVFPYQTTDGDTFMRPYAHQWWNWSNNPWFDFQKYDFLAATHEQSTQFNQHYYFLPLPFELGAPVFDYRFLQSTGPFKEFKPGQRLRFVFAVGAGDGFQGMRENMDNALKAYYAGAEWSHPYRPSSPDFEAPNGDLHWFLSSPPPIPNLKYSPLDEAVRLAWDNSAESTVDIMSGEKDFVGYKIYRSVHNHRQWEMIAAFDNIDAPVLVTNATGEILNAKKDLATGATMAYGEPGYHSLEAFEYVKIDLPPIIHHYDDHGGSFLDRTIQHPINGLKYYYSLVSYDRPQPARWPFPAMPAQESPKTNYKKDADSGRPIPVIPTHYYHASEVNQLRLSEVKVVPNPYKGTSLFESVYEDKIQFINLPPACKISIFTLTGDLVDTVYHDDGSDSEFWYLISRTRLRLVSGLYLYVVETEIPKYEKVTGKFVIIR